MLYYVWLCSHLTSLYPPTGSTSPSPGYIPAPHPTHLLRSQYDRGGDSKVWWITPLASIPLTVLKN